ncbi:MAG TPA: phenylalanine--tRNA ligase subunit beta, partial [Polyangiaceae bacterium]|nr:phenylalanine--tRNA ligase subunit beta [Polyangiaceae bacterium]
MFISLRWLSELLPTAQLDSVETAEALTSLGLAVDGVKDHGEALRPVVIAEVVDVAPHPNRDGLRLVSIKIGKAAHSSFGSSLPPTLPGAQLPQELTVVCGAKNVPAPGGLVVFAGLGVKLPGVDFVLTRRDIGGVVSEGMLCSEAELGLAESSEGILTFPSGSFASGARFIDAFPEARDVIFELDVTPNRPDALGHVGVARDLSAYLDVELLEPPSSPLTEVGAACSASIVVKNQAQERCPRYGAAVVRDVRIQPSPDFMRWRLHRLGVRPISNVVDITNWLLMEYGQPLHAFDLTHVKGGELTIRTAQETESIKTLDGALRALSPDDLVICDAGGPTALAGIMGGQHSEIVATTRDVVLECAYFAPQGVRRTARRQGMHTESSHRFERGTDHGKTAHVLDRARYLLSELASGQVAPAPVRADGVELALPLLELHERRLESLLGVNVPFKTVVEILGRLGLRVEYLVDTNEGSVASVRGASHRPDIRIEQDLIEEIARVRGLDNIPTVLPAIPPQTPRTSGDLERLAARVAVEIGLSEALTHAFVAAPDLAALHAPLPIITLVNPLSEDRSVLRTSLAPGLIEAVRRSRRRGEPRIQLFTIGAIFLPNAPEHAPSSARVRQKEDLVGLPYEQPTFTAILAGPRDEYMSLKPEQLDIYDAKAIAVEMVERMTKKRARVAHVGRTPQTEHLHPRGAATITVDDKPVGVFGPLHPDVVEYFDMDGPALLVELNLAAIEALGTVVPRYRPIPKLPAVTRDLSLVVEDKTPADRVVELLLQASGDICEIVDIA